MRKLDKLIIGELIGPWFFGMAIFTVLIMAGSFLFEFTELLAKGVPFWVVGQLAALLIPGVMAKTFSMAMLLGTLLAFGRLSGDSEIVALRAAGESVWRIMLPVAIAGAIVSLATFGVNDYLVPSASLRAESLQDELSKSLDATANQPTAQPLVKEGVLVGYLVAQDFSLANRTLKGVQIITYDKQGNAETVLDVAELQFDSLEEWKIIGKARLLSMETGVRVTFEEGVWPENSERPNLTPEEMMVRNLRDLDARSSRDIQKDIVRMKAEPEEQQDKKQIINLEFGYWNKFSLPLAALVFGLVGAPLGIRSHRAGTATGFWLSVIIIFGYMMITNSMSILAQGGAIPAWVASFAPILIGLVTGVVLIHRKNSQ